jgi:hypothetical protein
MPKEYNRIIIGTIRCEDGRYVLRSRTGTEFVLKEPLPGKFPRDGDEVITALLERFYPETETIEYTAAAIHRLCDVNIDRNVLTQARSKMRVSRKIQAL